MHREAFKRIKNYYGITGKQLHEVTGVSQNHISEFLTGKREVSTAILDKLVQAMEEIAPGAKEDYAREIMGRKRENFSLNLKKLIESIPPEKLVEAMDNQKFAAVLNAFAESIGRDRMSGNTRINTDAKPEFHLVNIS